MTTFPEAAPSGTCNLDLLGINCNDFQIRSNYE
jgi:hypothetical protein